VSLLRSRTRHLQLDTRVGRKGLELVEGHLAAAAGHAIEVFDQLVDSRRRRPATAGHLIAQGNQLILPDGVRRTARSFAVGPIGNCHARHWSQISRTHVVPPFPTDVGSCPHGESASAGAGTG
jgi:hypothetical protein